MEALLALAFSLTVMAHLHVRVGREGKLTPSASLRRAVSRAKLHGVGQSTSAPAGTDGERHRQ
jgi:hypothetical protein